jgi:hypothetical protein
VCIACVVKDRGPIVIGVTVYARPYHSAPRRNLAATARKNSKPRAGKVVKAVCGEGGEGRGVGRVWVPVPVAT